MKNTILHDHRMWQSRNDIWREDIVWTFSDQFPSHGSHLSLYDYDLSREISH
ncbi:hypothetical protein [Neobacillus cucumis]|uniref:hypothetical protein n=1 Tax=Neobacillus cucumis TaxID=1740721 RepID=UPI002E22B158|nr:hypothetical protein [Neobacillus cucumis]